MKLKIYASYNKLACEMARETFMAPNDNVAKNMVENGFYNKEGKIDNNAKRNAKNYNLCYLGEYDTECGITGLGSDYRIVAEYTELIPAQTEDGPTE